MFCFFLVFFPSPFSLLLGDAASQCSLSRARRAQRRVAATRPRRPPRLRPASRAPRVPVCVCRARRARLAALRLAPALSEPRRRVPQCVRSFVNRAHPARPGRDRRDAAPAGAQLAFVSFLLLPARDATGWTTVIEGHPTRTPSPRHSLDGDYSTRTRLKFDVRAAKKTGNKQRRDLLVLEAVGVVERVHVGPLEPVARHHQ